MRRHLHLAVMAALSLLGGCDDMTTQPKQNAYRAATVGPGKVPPNRVEYGGPAAAPPAVTAALLQRGQDQFRQFCTPCHSELGDGHGIVVQRGFSPPPSYHEARLRDAPTSHFYDVITQGYGAMYSFAARIRPADRWAIAGYIRVLQHSMDGRLEDLPADQRARMTAEQAVPSSLPAGPAPPEARP
jgi:mono/diheme cytochrome c family protein